MFARVWGVSGALKACCDLVELWAAFVFRQNHLCGPVCPSNGLGGLRES